MSVKKQQKSSKFWILQEWSEDVLITNKIEQNFLWVIFSRFRDHRMVYWRQIWPLCVLKYYHENCQISMMHTYIERKRKVPLFLTWKCWKGKLHFISFILHIDHFSIELIVLTVEQFEFWLFQAKNVIFSKMWIRKIHTSVKKYHSN